MASTTNLTLLEENMGGKAVPVKKSRKKLWITLGVIFALLAAGGITVGVLFQQKILTIGSGADSSSSSSSSNSPNKPGSGSPSDPSDPISDDPPPLVKCTDAGDIPDDVAGTPTDPTSWLDMTGFNCTYTDATVGDLPLVGLMSSWDDSARANPNVPALDKDWGSYEKRPIRGVNLGGWLSLEPFITRSLFDYDAKLGVVDEWTLCDHLGPEKAAEVLEKHYATFVTERDFKNIAAAGLDHIRIPFSYWVAETYDDDSYVPHVSWRYLLRGIEWARKYGLRVKLDLHGIPGSQNGWNHSGRSSEVGFIMGKNGSKNAKRALEIHDRLSKFFAQDRYRNVVAFYGLGNEPALKIPLDELADWTAEAYAIVQKNGVKTYQVFSDSMRPNDWQGQLTTQEKLVMDAHIYGIFNNDMIALEPKAKISLACNDWAAHMDGSQNKATGFGPTMVGEWSQADTDCTEHLNGVRGGTRWEGTWFDTIGKPNCAARDDSCSCDKPNADPEDYSDEYRQFLLYFAIAQMDAYERSWGWFYWTWKTETAHQWSYEAGLKGKYMPEIAYERDWDCSKKVPAFDGIY